MMTNSFELQFRVLVPGTEPIGEEISSSDLAVLLQDKVIDENTQVWDEENKCWSALHRCESTKKLIQNLQKKQSQLQTVVVEPIRSVSTANDVEEMQNVETTSIETSQNMETHSASLWDAWDESSIRVIVDEESNGTSSVNQSHLIATSIQDLPEIDLTELEVSPSESPEQVHSNGNQHLSQNDPQPQNPQETDHNGIEHNPFLASADMEFDVQQSNSSPRVQNTDIFEEGIDIDLEQSFKNETTSDIPMFELEELVDRQAELEKELAADMMETADMIEATNKMNAKKTQVAEQNKTVAPKNQVTNAPKDWQDFSTKSKVLQNEQQTMDFLSKQIFSAQNINDLKKLNSKGYDVYNRPPRSKSTLNWVRIIMLLIPGVIVLWVFQLYVQAVSDTSVKSVSRMSIMQEKEELSAYQILEQEVRGNLPADVKPVKQTQAESLQSALFVQLSQQQLRISNIEAAVIKWGGRKLDEPQKAEVSIRLITEKELDREIAIVAMTLGLYMEHYALEIDKLEVIYQDSLSMYSIPTESAHRLYLRDMTLEAFFDDMLTQ